MCAGASLGRSCAGFHPQTSPCGLRKSIQSTPLVLTSDKAIFFYNDVFFRNGNEPLYISIKILRLTRLRYIQISLVTMQFSIPKQKFYSVRVMLPPWKYKSCAMSDNSLECTKYYGTMCLKRRVTPGGRFIRVRTHT